MVNLNVNANSDYAQILFLSANNKAILGNNSIEANTSDNFKLMITELFNKNVSEEKINIIENLINNKKLYNSLNQAAAFFIITDGIKNIPLLTDAELQDNNIIKEIAFSNNLSHAEKNLLIKALKFAAIEITTSASHPEGSIQNISLVQQSKNIEKLNTPLRINNITGENDYPANSNNEKNILNKITISTSSQNTNSLTQNINLADNNNLVKNNNIISENITIIKGQGNDISNIHQTIQNNSIGILDTKANIVNSHQTLLTPLLINNNTVNNSQPIVNDMVENSAREIKIINNTQINDSFDVVQKIQNNAINIFENIKQVMSYIKVSADKIINDKNIADREKIEMLINELNAKINNIINSINKIKSTLADNEASVVQGIKENIELIIREIISILPVIQNIIYKGNTQNNFAAVVNNQIEENELPVINTNSQQIDFNLKNENKNSSYHKETQLFNEIKDSVIRIFTLLKELNGEMQIYKKIEYVYQPNTTKTSTITPDGLLLINLSPIVKAEGKLSISQLMSDIPSEKISINSFTKNDSALTVIKATDNKVNLTGLNSNTIEEVAHNVILQNLSENKQKLNMQLEINNISLKQDIMLKNNKDISFIMNNLLDSIKKNQEVDKSDKNNIFKDIIQSGQKIKEDIIIKQVIEKITDYISIKEKIQIKIYLKPENLGPVFIRIENKGKEISANIQVVNSEVKDILKANILELKNSLNNLGLDVKDFEISMMNQNVGSNLSDAYDNIYYKEWQGAALINKNVQEMVDIDDIYNESFSYLNYLA